MPNSDPDIIAANHTPELIRERLALKQQSYLSDFIYGAIDGTVTTFAVVSGVAGAQLQPGIVIVLGFANLVGDGFSMAASNYSGTRADEQLRDRAREIEAEEIDAWPDGEREEIRQIYAAKGFEGQDLERVVSVITADRERWIDTMVSEDLGLRLASRSPLRAAISTFIAFLLLGFLPLLSFVINYFFPQLITNPYPWSCVLTAIAFFSVGATKSQFVQQHWFFAGCETLLLGGGAALLAYLIGAMLRGVVA